MIEWHLTVWQNLGILGLAVALFALCVVTSRAYDNLVWGLRILHVAAPILCGLVFAIDGIMAALTGRFLAAIGAGSLFLTLLAFGVSNAKNLPKDIEWEKNRAKLEGKTSGIDRFWDRVERFWARFEAWQTKRDEARRNRKLEKLTLEHEARLRAEKKLAAEGGRKEEGDTEQQRNAPIA